MAQDLYYIIWMAILTLGLVYMIFKRNADAERVTDLELDLRRLEQAVQKPAGQTPPTQQA
jgi:hypothetical protein